MWCTRWFLLLFLLPYPRASPYFLILYLFSLILHSRPCLYCVVLLTALFTSSCYWAPAEVPIPFFLSSSHTPEPAKPEERCWCDLNNGNLFDPFPPTLSRSKDLAENTGTILADQAQDLDNDVLARVQPLDIPPNLSQTSSESTAAASKPPAAVSFEGLAGTSLRWLLSKFSQPAVVLPTKGDFTAPDRAAEASAHVDAYTSSEAAAPVETVHASGVADERISWIKVKRRYDLREYGVGLIVDFGWGRGGESGSSRA